jgi:hypothetical protein
MHVGFCPLIEFQHGFHKLTNKFYVIPIIGFTGSWYCLYFSFSNLNAVDYIDFLSPTYGISLILYIYIFLFLGKVLFYHLLCCPVRV